MSAFNDHFDIVWYINLDRRTDRRERMEEVFKEQDIGVVRFPAIEPWEGTANLRPQKLGNKLSHLKVIELSAGTDSIFVFEDDVEFHRNFHQLFDEFMEQVPDDWDMIFLGVNPKGEKRFLSKRVYQVDEFWTTHAYGIRSGAYQRILDNVMRLDKPKDVVMCELVYPEINVYIAFPHLVWQIDDYSDGDGAFVYNSRYTR